MLTMPPKLPPILKRQASGGKQSTLVRSLLEGFRESEQWSPDKRLAYQFDRINALVSHCDRVNVFWRRRLLEAGIQAGVPITPGLWAGLPVLTRAEAQDAGMSLQCLSYPTDHGDITISSTSGSTGRPLRTVRTTFHQTYWLSFAIRDVIWHKFNLRGKIVFIRRDRASDPGPGRGRSFPNWGSEIAQIFPTGPASIFDITKPISEQAAWLLREKPDYVLSWASNLNILARYFRDNNLKLKRLRALQSFGEAVSPELRELCREVFGVPIFNCYSSEEVGYMALQCPQHEHLHVMAEGVYLEVLDDDGNACKPGEIGRVVVTPLHNYAMPLLRYELGDYAEVGGLCDCGCTLPVLNQVLGRARNRLLLPSGESRFADFGGKKLNEIRFIRQFQLVQKTRMDFTLNIVTRHPPDAEEVELARKTVQDALGFPCAIRIVCLESIPRSSSGKFEDFRSEAT